MSVVFTRIGETVVESEMLIMRLGCGRKTYGPEDENKTLAELGLAPSAILNLAS